MKRRFRILIAACAFVTAAVGLAACGGEGSPALDIPASSTTTGGAPSSTTAPVTSSTMGSYGN